MPKVANVAEAMRKEAEKQKKVGPTVKLRAIEQGFYGYPPNKIEPGEIFKHRVDRLELFKKGMVNRGGIPMRTMTIEGKEYALPAWCEDASEPSSLIETEDEDDSFALSQADTEM